MLRQGVRSTSPYTANQSLLRDLTLPPVPNMEIPDSPPGTPPPSLDALNKKFSTFLDFKRNKGTHFNARLSQSSAARNPALMDKLLAFVGVDPSFEDATGGDVDGAGAARKKLDPAAQYATTLSADLWDPAAFPEWAFRGPLRRSQDVANRERARGPGQPVDFVAATSGPSSRGGSQTGTPKGAGAGRRKTRFDA